MPELWKWIRVGGVLKGDALDADEARPTLRRDKRGLTRGHFDHVVGGRSGSQAHLNSGPTGPPRSARRASHPPPASSACPGDAAAIRFAVGRNREVGCGLGSRGAAQPRCCSTGSSGLLVDEHKSTSAQEGPDVDRAGIEPRPVPPMMLGKAKGGRHRGTGAAADS